MRPPDLLPGSVLAPLTDQIKSSLRAPHLKFKGGISQFWAGSSPREGAEGSPLTNSERGGLVMVGGYSDIKRFLPHSPSEGNLQTRKVLVAKCED